MNNETLLRALSFVDEKYIEEAAEGTAAESEESGGTALPAEEAGSSGPAEEKEERKEVKVRQGLPGRYKKMIRIGSAIAAAAVLAMGLLHSDPSLMNGMKSAGTPEASPMAPEAAEQFAEASSQAASDAIDQLINGDISKEEPSAKPEGSVTGSEEGEGLVYTAEASYPEQAKYPEEPGEEAYASGFDWNEYNKNRKEQMNAWQADADERAKLSAGAAKGLESFTEQTMKVFLRSKNGENVLYSPVNVYMALSMLAETTDGDTRQQILDVLGLTDIDALREKASKIWYAAYVDDGRKTSLPGASIWLDDQLKYKTDVLDRLAENYFASSYIGDLQSAAVQKAFTDWLSGMTKGLLDEHIQEIEFSDQLRAIIASTLYYKASWTDSFAPEITRDDVFHAETGDETAPFMRRTGYMPLYKGDGFKAVSLSLNGGDSMRLILPDEGTSAEELAASDKLYGYLTRPLGEDGSESARVMIKMPKFDADSEKDLIEGLTELGVTDVFGGKADFSPLSDQSLAVDEISHAVRVKADEDGVEAAAYTVIMVKATAALIEEPPFEFILDRPFIFEIVSSDGLPLFCGVVNHVE
ncbi:MAG: hypothetical protein IJM17_04215 [Firmicutes bacterium]|nr:hypothetical protein [Bacillota bacterium]